MDLYFTRKAKGLLFKDDGDGYGFIEGEYLLIHYVAELKSSVVTVSISETKGLWKRPDRRVHIQLRRPPCPPSLQIIAVFCGALTGPQDSISSLRATFFFLATSNLKIPDCHGIAAYFNSNNLVSILIWFENFDLTGIRACIKVMHPVNEEPFEVRLDNHGYCDGPKTSRLKTLDNAPKLFDGFSFYFVGDFDSSYKE